MEQYTLDSFPDFQFTGNWYLICCTNLATKYRNHLWKGTKLLRMGGVVTYQGNVTAAARFVVLIVFAQSYSEVKM